MVVFNLLVSGCRNEELGHINPLVNINFDAILLVVLVVADYIELQQPKIKVENALWVST